MEVSGANMYFVYLNHPWRLIPIRRKVRSRTDAMIPY